jgi:hypothetical protein
MTGFFSLRNPADLREKLRRDLERLKAAPMSADAAFDFFVTALHMLDWIYPKREKDAERDAAEKKSTLLQVCSHLANGAKHFETEAKKHKSVTSTGRMGSILSVIHHPASLFGGEDRLIVRLKGDAPINNFGETIGVVELAEKVMEYWDTNPDNHPL